MKTSARWISFVALIAALPAVGAELVVHDPWVRAAPPGARMMAGYAGLENAGDGTVALVGADSTAFGAVELHTMVEVDGVMRMRAVPTLPVEAGGRVDLAPGGLHLMLMRPVAPLSEGDRVAITLRWDDGSTQAVEFVVRTPAPAGDPQPHRGH